MINETAEACVCVCARASERVCTARNMTLNGAVVFRNAFNYLNLLHRPLYS
jgi:hypothetical protein